MPKRNKLSDQLADLFSDLAAPEPIVAKETGQESVDDDILGSLQEMPAPEPLPPEPEPEPVGVEPTSFAEAQVVEDMDQDLPEPDQPEKHHGAPGRRGMRMHRWSGLGRKLILAFLAAAIIPSLIISMFGVVSQATRVQSNATDNLDLLTALQQNQVEQWLESQIAALSSLAHDPSFQHFLATEEGERDRQATHLAIGARLSSFKVQHPDFDEVFLLNADGRVVVATDAMHQDSLEQDMPYFVQGREKSYFAPSVFVESLNRPSLVIAEPLRYITGETIGVMVGFVNPEPLTHLMHSAPGLGESGETYLVNENGELVTVLQRQGGPTPGEPIASTGVAKAIAGGSGRGRYANYAGKQVLGVYRWLPVGQMGLLAEREYSEAFHSIFVVVGATAVVTLIAVALTTLLASQFAKRIAQPIVRITEAARQMVAGDLNQSVTVNRTDEVGELALAFNQMADQLRMTIGGLEASVAERTKQLQQATDRYRKRAVHLEASAEINRAAASILDPKELMQSTVDLIRERFDLYHVSFFLLDETEEWAVVVASTGDVGRQMVAQPHRLRVGGDSLVGWVCAYRQPRIALDVGAAAVHFANPLLPYTRSEMVLPLLVGDRLSGALDVQSDKEAAFDEDDVRALQSMADLIAVTLRNARLFSEARRGAWHQQFITRFTDHLQQATNITDVLTLTLEELGEAFNLAQATICLGTEAELMAAGNGNEGRVSTE